MLAICYCIYGVTIWMVMVVAKNVSGHIERSFHAPALNADLLTFSDTLEQLTNVRLLCPQSLLIVYSYY